MVIVIIKELVLQVLDLGNNFSSHWFRLFQSFDLSGYLLPLCGGYPKNQHVLDFELLLNAMVRLLPLNLSVVFKCLLVDVLNVLDRLLVKGHL